MLVIVFVQLKFKLIFVPKKKETTDRKNIPNETKVVKLLSQIAYIMMSTKQLQWIVDKLQLKQSSQEEMKKHRHKPL